MRHGWIFAIVAAAAGGLAITAELVADAGLGSSIADLVTGLTVVACGLWGMQRQPSELRWLLLSLAGVVWFAGNFLDAGSTVVSSIGAVLIFLHRGFFVHATVASSRARYRPLMVLAVVAGYAAALVTGTLNGTLTVVSAALVGGLAAWTIVRRGVRVARHDILVTSSQLVLAAALALAGVIELSHVDFAASQIAGYGYEAGLTASALLLAAASGAEARTRAMLADLVVTELGRARRPATVRGALARALGDRSLQVGYWVATAGCYVDAAGFTVVLPQRSDQRAAIVVERDGEPVAALVHDPAVLEDPSLSEAVREATALLFANSRLEAEVATQLGELRASRGRIVQARDDQRRRLARLLQDGAERRLVEVGAAIERARALAARDLCDLDLLDVLGQELELARVELGALARGIHPRALTESGLAAALSALVGRAPFPIELIAPAERMPVPIEAAAYFVCSEAVTNVAKYAHATHVRCEVRRRDDLVAVAVVDDGVGGADPGAGSGLRGLADRIDALGGRFTVTSPAGKGTIITAELPVEGSW